MRLQICALLLCIPLFASGQDRSTELGRAAEQARAAYLALQEAEKRRAAGMEPLPEEHSGLAGGGSRLNEQYFARQGQLEQEVETARQRYENAQRRWNDLK
jgi:hypothetical protein